MHGEIDVGTLLLGPDHLDCVPPPHRPRQRRSDPVLEKMPEIHLYLWSEALERTEIEVLPLGLGLVSSTARDSSGEVLDLENAVMLLQNHLAQSDQIQPLP